MLVPLAFADMHADVVYSGQEITIRGKTYPPNTKIYEVKAGAAGSLSFLVPDGWGDRSGQRWSKYVQIVQNVSALGKALGYTEGQALGHAYWLNENMKFQGVYFELKNGAPGIQFVPWVKMFIPGFGEPKFPPNLDSEYYTFRGTVYSARPIAVKGKNWLVMSKVLEVGHKFVRGEEKEINGRRCLRADPIVKTAFPFGEALGYMKGERVGPPYWAEWQPKDDHAKNPIAPYEENELLVKYGGMAKPETQKFDSSIAFWVYDHMLVLVFRNFRAPNTKYDADPPVGRASLIVMVRKHTGLASNGRALGFEEVTAGTYEPGVLRWGMVRPPGGLFISDKSGIELGVGVFWKLNKTSRASLSMWQDFRSMNLAEMRSFMEKLGTVRLTAVGRRPGARIKGFLALGNPEEDNVARGFFNIPVVEKPKDFK